MNKAFFVSFSLVVLLFSQCKKDNTGDGTVFNTNFYTSVSTSKSAIHLYIDGKEQGQLPYFSEEPNCGGTNSDGVKPLILQLISGTYKIEGKDVNGKVISSGDIYLSKNSVSSSGGFGGQSVSSTDKCAIVGLFE